MKSSTNQLFAFQYNKNELLKIEFMNNNTFFKESREFLNKGYHVETVKYGEKEKEVYDIIKPDYVTGRTLDMF